MSHLGYMQISEECSLQKLTISECNLGEIPLKTLLRAPNLHTLALRGTLGFDPQKKLQFDCIAQPYSEDDFSNVRSWEIRVEARKSINEEMIVQHLCQQFAEDELACVESQEYCKTFRVVLPDSVPPPEPRIFAPFIPSLNDLESRVTRLPAFLDSFN